MRKIFFIVFLFILNVKAQNRKNNISILDRRESTQVVDVQTKSVMPPLEAHHFETDLEYYEYNAKPQFKTHQALILAQVLESAVITSSEGTPSMKSNKGSLSKFKKFQILISMHEKDIKNDSAPLSSLVEFDTRTEDLPKEGIIIETNFNEAKSSLMLKIFPNHRIEIIELKVQTSLQARAQKWQAFSISRDFLKQDSQKYQIEPYVAAENHYKPHESSSYLSATFKNQMLIAWGWRRVTHQLDLSARATNLGYQHFVLINEKGELLQSHKFPTVKNLGQSWSYQKPNVAILFKLENESAKSLFKKIKASGALLNDTEFSFETRPVMTRKYNELRFPENTFAAGEKLNDLGANNQSETTDKSSMISRQCVHLFN